MLPVIRKGRINSTLPLFPDCIMRMSFCCLLGGIFWHLCCYHFFQGTLGINMVSLHRMSQCPHQSVHPCQIRISHIVFCTFPNLSKSFISPAHCHRLLVWHKTQAQNEKDKTEKRQQTQPLLFCFVTPNKIWLIALLCYWWARGTTRCGLPCPVNITYSWNILYLPISVSKVQYVNRERNISLSSG